MPIEVHSEGPIAFVAIAGADAGNALTVAMCLDLDRRLRALDADASVRAIVLIGADDGDFSAGMDPRATVAMLEDMRDLVGVARHYVYPLAQRPPSPWAAWRTLLARRTVKPVVAAVRGRCHGLALMILGLHSDVRVAGESARFGFPDIHQGLGSGQAIASGLSSQIPTAAVHWLVQTGQPLDARQALRYGLVNEVVADADVSDRARAVAERIARRAPLALRAEKLAAIHLERADYDDAVVLGSALATLARLGG